MPFDREKCINEMIASGISGEEALKITDFSECLEKKIIDLIESEFTLWRDQLDKEDIITSTAAVLSCITGAFIDKTRIADEIKEDES